MDHQNEQTNSYSNQALELFDYFGSSALIQPNPQVVDHPVRFHPKKWP